MKTAINLFSVTFLTVILFCDKQQAQDINTQSEIYLGIPSAAIEKELTDLLNAWYPALIDTVNGGYWTNLAYDWTLLNNQDKMLVTQARGLWTAAKAAALFPDNPVFRKAADHGYRFLTEKMWDYQNGGFYLYYYIESQSVSSTQFKLIYGNAFALYALSEYAKINNSPDVLGWLKKTFQWLDQAAHDRQYKGYYNYIIPQNAQGRSQNFFMGDPDLKDQNNHIHLMEAFANTFLVWPDPVLKERLDETFKLVRDTMVNEKGYLNLFFSKEWKPVNHTNEPRDYILQNIYSDHVSFGHNIETAFLLLDASKALYGAPDSLTIDVARMLIDHTLINGFDKEYYGLYDKGYYFKDKAEIEIVNDDKVWWSQAEAWHALALITQYYPHNEKYSRAFAQMWTYINEQMIDRRYRGWYSNGLDSNPGNRNEPKGNQWKGCYHNGRALMLVYQYSNK
jgi:cellobiose epimerase